MFGIHSILRFHLLWLGLVLAVITGGHASIIRPHHPAALTLAAQADADPGVTTTPSASRPSIPPATFVAALPKCAYASSSGPSTPPLHHRRPSPDPSGILALMPILALTRPPRRRRRPTATSSRRIPHAPSTGATTTTPRHRPHDSHPTLPAPTDLPKPIPAFDRIPFWPSRDPIGERGGVNLYGFNFNAPIARFDDFGHESREQREATRRARNRANEEGRINNRNTEKTRNVTDGMNRNSPTSIGEARDEASRRARGVGAAVDAVKEVQDWISDIQGYLKIADIEKKCDELAEKRKAEEGWTSCRACCFIYLPGAIEGKWANH